MRALELLSAGAGTLEVGRRAYGQAHHGIPLGGPADAGSHAAANLLVGNEPDAPALEITLLGPRVRFTKDCWFAITGAPFDARLDGVPVALWETHRAQPGQVLVIRGTPTGARCYLATGSAQRSRTVAVQHPVPAHISNRDPQGAVGTQDLRITGGPIDAEYTVAQDSNRRGIRLLGPPLEGGEIITEGVSAGAIQVPPGGQPIILFVDQTTTGGYRKAAHVIRADLDRVGQLRPGDRVRFRTISIEEAVAAWRNRST